MHKLQQLVTRLVPPFLRRIDYCLLLRHPLVWATRVHYVVFYGLLAFLFLSALLPLIKSSDFEEIVIITIGAVGMWWGYDQVITADSQRFRVQNSFKHLLMLTTLNVACMYTFVLLIVYVVGVESLHNNFWFYYFFGYSDFSGLVIQLIPVVLLVSASIMISQHVPFRGFLLSAVGYVLVQIVISVVSRHISREWMILSCMGRDRQEALPEGIVFLLIYGLILWQTWCGQKQDRFSVARIACAAIGCVMSIHVFFHLEGIAGNLLELDVHYSALPPAFYYYTLVQIIAPLAGSLLFVFVFRKRFLRLKSLPQKS